MRLRRRRGGARDAARRREGESALGEEGAGRPRGASGGEGWEPPVGGGSRGVAAERFGRGGGTRFLFRPLPPAAAPAAGGGCSVKTSAPGLPAARVPAATAATAATAAAGGVAAAAVRATARRRAASPVDATTAVRRRQRQCARRGEAEGGLSPLAPRPHPPAPEKEEPSVDPSRRSAQRGRAPRGGGGACSPRAASGPGGIVGGGFGGQSGVHRCYCGVAGGGTSTVTLPRRSPSRSRDEEGTDGGGEESGALQCRSVRLEGGEGPVVVTAVTWLADLFQN